MPAARIDGIHHVTAIASDPQPNLDFYVRFLGLRLVKRTVNFDDPGTYHFYYGDEIGRPGTILTFFPWPGARRGRHGPGQVTVTSFAVPHGSAEYWIERAQRFGVALANEPERFGETVLRVHDGDGLAVELIPSIAAGADPGSDGVDMPAEYRIRSLHSATLSATDPRQTADLLAGTMGLREIAREGGRIRYAAGDGGPGAIVDLAVDPAGRRGLQGAGTVHHIAFRTPDDAQQGAWLRTLTELGYNVSPVMDRNYFHSIYYREPGGILFEIATDPPGFTIDERAEELGTSLMLPPMYESMRERIESALPSITVPTAGLLTELY
jgi:catechol 2,3-dioxygenase-like lactoylglutathione lyase family enzyme